MRVVRQRRGLGAERVATPVVVGLDRPRPETQAALPKAR